MSGITSIYIEAFFFLVLPGLPSELTHRTSISFPSLAKHIRHYSQSSIPTNLSIIMLSQRVLKSSAPLVGTAVIGGGILAASLYNSSNTQSPSSPAADHAAPPSAQTPRDAKKIFTSGFSFQNLKLESSEVVNHNTKRLRFQLPEKDAVSGLHPSCTFAPSSPQHLTYTYKAIEPPPPPPQLPF